MKKQYGFAHAFLIIGLVVALVGALGFIFWQNFIHEEPTVEQTTTQAQKPAADSTDTKGYKNAFLGVSFTYPKTWKSLSCDGKENEAVYFATDSRGISESHLCGSGSDYQAQMTFQRTTDDEIVMSGQKPTKTFKINGFAAAKYVTVSDGESIRPKGFKSIDYVVQKDGSGEILQFSYAKWPKSMSDDYDTSDASEEAFVKLVEYDLTVL